MKALICGISGQDGAYLSKFLLNKGYEVIGTSRDINLNKFTNLKFVKCYQDIKIESMSLNDFKSIFSIVNKYKPDEIYNLAGQSSVGLSFEKPKETMESIALGNLNILEVIRKFDYKIRFFSAGSCDCFGDTKLKKANENTRFLPKSPYAVAKCAAFWTISGYRDSYDVFASTGILFNHESILRPEKFVTQKIVVAAARIKAGSKESLSLGNCNIQRDWGWSEDYVEAMWSMLQIDKPQDFVIATGETNSLRKFVEKVFQFFDLNWQDHVEIDSQNFRPTDINFSGGDPSLASKVLRWEAKTKFDDLIIKMCENAYEKKIKNFT